MQEKELAQSIEDFIEIQDMEEELESQNQDFDIILSTQQVTIYSPHPPTEQAPREEEEIVPLDDGLVMYMYNLTYDELRKNIVKLRMKHCLDDLASPTFIRERVIITNTKRNTGGIFTANLAFMSATK